MKRYLPFLLSISLLSGCAAPASCGKTMQNTENDVLLSTENSTQLSRKFDTFLDDLFLSQITSNTINLHFTLSAPENYGITEIPISLGDLSKKAVSKSYASLENTCSALKSFDYSALNRSQQLTYDVLSSYLNTELSAADLTLYDEILRPSTGIQAQLPVLYEEYKFYGTEDVDDYLELIALTDDYFSQIIDFEREKADAGLFMSDFACDTIISQCEDFIANADEHYLIKTFDNKIDKMEMLTDEQRTLYKSRNETLVKEQILPAYQTLADALTTLLGSGVNEQGLCYFADGTEYYEYLTAHNTGSSSPVEAIQDMIEEKRLSDLTETAALTQENPAVWKECQAVSLSGLDSETTLQVLQGQMLKHFPKPPETNFTVSYIDECMEDYMAPAFYITAPLDNYENNAIFINARTDATSMQYFTTLAHEGFPGHLYQTVMSYEAGLPEIRSVLNFPGYIEGWATYVEMLSYQYAGLPEDVAKMLSLNQSALLSLYASTDIGIHYDGWSFEDMLQFWSDYGITDKDTLRNVYELIVEEPTHYLKYYVGYLEFLKLKETAREMYGSNYSDVAFHRAVLSIGPAPFSIVEKYLDDYYVSSGS